MGYNKCHFVIFAYCWSGCFRAVPTREFAPFRETTTTFCVRIAWNMPRVAKLQTGSWQVYDRRKDRDAGNAGLWCETWPALRVYEIMLNGKPLLSCRQLIDDNPGLFIAIRQVTEPKFKR